jgi:hypothetical protein
MLEFDPAQRASAAQMLAHPWLRGELPMQSLFNNISSTGGALDRAPRVKWGSPRSPAGVLGFAPLSPMRCGWFSGEEGRRREM